MNMKYLFVMIVALMMVATASAAMWDGRMLPVVTAASDGRICLSGGTVGWSDADTLIDSWCSVDSGGSWQLYNGASEWGTVDWGKRWGQAGTVLSNDHIILLGGWSDYSAAALPDVWVSEDHGASWVMTNDYAAWGGRYLTSLVTLPDNSIVMLGGRSSGYKNDTWRSTDVGVSWVQMNASSGWLEREGLCSVVTLDGDIILMGGGRTSADYNDVWRSTDNASTWTQINASAGWSGRRDFGCAIQPNGGIVVAGGVYGGDGLLFYNDVWRSIDGGVTWVQMTGSAEWTPRGYIGAVALPDNSIEVIAGRADGEVTFPQEVWRSFDNGATWSLPPWSAGGQVTFDGYVNDAETGLTIPGAVVEITQLTNVSTTNLSADGYYNTTATFFSTGITTMFNVMKSGYRDYNVTTVPPLAKSVHLNFTLNSTTPSYTGLGIGGVARDGVFTLGTITKGYGSPIEGATVYLVNNTNYEVHAKTTSMTGWYLCDEGSSCYVSNARPYGLWGNKSGYADSPEYTVEVFQ